MLKKMHILDYIDAHYTGSRKPDPRTILSRIDRGEVQDVDRYVKEGRDYYLFVNPIYDDQWAFDIFAKHGAA